MDIQAAEHRCEAATEGEWKLVRSPHSDRTMISSGSGKVIGAIIGIKDAEFVVHARSDLPAALGKLEALRKEILSAPPSARIRRMTAILGESE